MFLISWLLILIIAAASRAITICGYNDGDPQSPRTAHPGYECRVDTANGLWGFCPTTVSSAPDCGLAGVCVDSHSCTEGCGRLTDRTDITTFSCNRSQFCSTVLSINGPDQSFEYIACGAEARTDKLFPSRHTVDATTTRSSSTSSHLTNPASRPTATVAETSSAPASSLSSVADSSSTSDPNSTSSKQEPTNLGAIVGGVVGGLVVICLTILGVIFMRRKRGVKGQETLPLSHSDHSRNEFSDNAAPLARNSGDVKNNYHWNNSHGPVEMDSGRHVNIELAELPGQMHGTELSGGTK